MTTLANQWAITIHQDLVNDRLGPPIQDAVLRVLRSRNRGESVDRQVIRMSEMSPFSNHKFRVPFDAAGKKWGAVRGLGFGWEWSVHTAGASQVTVVNTADSTRNTAS